MPEMMLEMIPEMMPEMIPEMTLDYYHRCMIAARWSARLPQMGDRSYGLRSSAVSVVVTPSPDWLLYPSDAADEDDSVTPVVRTCM